MTTPINLGNQLGRHSNTMQSYTVDNSGYCDRI